MPRIGRIVLPGVPHHIAQKANGSLVLFPTDRDRHYYLTNLKSHCEKHGVTVYGYCLMTNHVHLILLPANESSLALVMRMTQGAYSRYYNTGNTNRGHVWQDRFYSCAMDDAHFLRAMRYVDRNPVRAGLVSDAMSYPWSSAGSHAGINDPFGLIETGLIRKLFGDLDWRAYIAEEDDEDFLASIREYTRLGRPMGQCGKVE
jgi:putative transposase